jgi:hypothetical protein
VTGRSQRNTAAAWSNPCTVTAGYDFILDLHSRSLLNRRLDRIDGVARFGGT